MGFCYEYFIRNAFSVDRLGDPAQLAEAGICDFVDNLPEVKAATAYAVCIYKRRAEDVNPSYGLAFIEPLKTILAAENIETVYQQIELIRNLPGFSRDEN